MYDNSLNKLCKLSDFETKFIFNALSVEIQEKYKLSKKQISLLPFITSLDIEEYLNSFLEGKNLHIIRDLVYRQELEYLKKYLCCGVIEHVKYCVNCSDSKKNKYGCGLRFCERCGNKRFHQLRDKYEPFFSKRHNLKFITLTFGEHDDFNSEILDDCRKKANKLLKKKYKGGLYAFEVKKRNHPS